MRVWITKSVQQATIGGHRADIVPASNYSSGGLVWNAFNVGLRMGVIRGRLFGLLTPVRPGCVTIDGAHFIPRFNG